MPAGADTEGVDQRPRRPGHRRRSRPGLRPRTCAAAAPATCPGWRSPVTRPASWPSWPPPSACSARCSRPPRAAAGGPCRASAETTDPLAMSAMLLDKSVTGVLVGAGDPPSADERRALGELAALVAAVAGRRPEVTVILAGGMAEHLAAFGDVGARPGEVVLGPAAQRGSPAGPLADLLIDHRASAGRRPPGARCRCRRPGRGPRPADRRRRDRLRRRDPRVGRAGHRRRCLVVRPGGRPDRGPGTGRARRLGHRSGGAVVDLGRRPAPPARPDARAADRPVVGRDRRGREPADGRRPRGARPAGRVDARMGEPPGGRPRSSRPVARGPSPRPRPSPSRWPTSCAGREPASSPSTTPGSSRRSGRSPTPTSDGR